MMLVIAKRRARRDSNLRIKPALVAKFLVKNEITLDFTLAVPTRHLNCPFHIVFLSFL